VTTRLSSDGRLFFIRVNVLYIGIGRDVQKRRRDISATVRSWHAALTLSPARFAQQSVLDAQARTKAALGKSMKTNPYAFVNLLTSSMGSLALFSGGTNRAEHHVFRVT